MSVFVSHDGDGTEVYVATAKGKVTQLEEKANAINAKIEAQYLDYPLNGWLNKDEPIVEVLRKAHEDGTEVEVRIESQRKKGIERSTPIQELRSNNPNKNIIKKLVAVNGVFTGEALTNPEDDPATGQATSAITHPRPKPSENQNGGGSSVSKESVLETLKSLATAREVSESVLDAVKAQALIAGATPSEVIEASSISPETPRENVGTGFSSEAPAFKEYNNDGRLNLGGPGVGAAVGSYNYVYDKLAKQLNVVEPIPETVEFFTHLILSISDRIQVGAYGTGFRIDRKAGSHTRARSCVYTIIDAGVSFPVDSAGLVADKEAVNSFVQIVGKAARHSFLTGIKASQTVVSVNAILASLDGDNDSQTEPETESGIIPPVEVQQEIPSIAEPTVTVIENIPEPQPVEEPVVEAVVVEEPVIASDDAVTVADGVELFPQDLLPPGAINASNAPTEDTLDEFKSFIIEEVRLQSKSEQAQVAKLLGYTFGSAYSKATNIPEEKLGDFLDFYVANGVDNFKAVLASL